MSEPPSNLFHLPYHLDYLAAISTGDLASAPRRLTLSYRIVRSSSQRIGAFAGGPFCGHGTEGATTTCSCLERATVQPFPPSATLHDTFTSHFFPILLAIFAPTTSYRVHLSRQTISAPLDRVAEEHEFKGEAGALFPRARCSLLIHLAASTAHFFLLFSPLVIIISPTLMSSDHDASRYANADRTLAAHLQLSTLEPPQ